MNKDNFLRFIITSLSPHIVSAIDEKATEDYLQQRADKQAFQRLLAKIPSRE